MNPFEKIQNFLRENKVVYELTEHEPVYTSAAAAAVRGFELKSGAKALLLKGGGSFVLIILPGSDKLDSRKVKNYLGVKDLRFATPEEVEKVMGCQIGACYPFGNLIDTRMIVDFKLAQNEKISFNPGVHNKSITMKYDDFARVSHAVLGDFSKDEEKT